MDNYGLSFLLHASEDKFLQRMNNISDKSYIFQEEHNVFIIPSAERLKYAFCVYYKTLEKYEKHPESLELGQKSEMRHPSYMSQIYVLSIRYLIRSC